MAHSCVVLCAWTEYHSGRSMQQWGFLTSLWTGGGQGGDSRTSSHDVLSLVRALFLEFLEHLEIPLAPSDQTSTRCPLRGHFVSKPQLGTTGHFKHLFRPPSWLCSQFSHQWDHRFELRVLSNLFLYCLSLVT